MNLCFTFISYDRCTVISSNDFQGTVALHHQCSSDIDISCFCFHILRNVCCYNTSTWCCNNSSHGESIADPFCHRHHIGNNVMALKTPEVTSCSPKSCLDLKNTAHGFMKVLQNGLPLTAGLTRRYQQIHAESLTLKHSLLFYYNVFILTLYTSFYIKRMCCVFKNALNVGYGCNLNIWRSHRSVQLPCRFFIGSVFKPSVKEAWHNYLHFFHQKLVFYTKIHLYAFKLNFQKTKKNLFSS